jgi:hypothetical protein
VRGRVGQRIEGQIQRETGAEIDKARDGHTDKWMDR